MQIDLDNLNKLVSKADGIFFTPEGEETLIELYAIQERVEEAITAAKAAILKTALKTDPNFSTIQGDKVKVAYRVYGAKYRIDEPMLPEIPKELYSVKTSYSVDSKKVDKWFDEHKGLPIGIIEPERERVISITLKGDKNDE